MFWFLLSGGLRVKQEELPCFPARRGCLVLGVCLLEMVRRDIVLDLCILCEMENFIFMLVVG